MPLCPCPQDPWEAQHPTCDDGDEDGNDVDDGVGDGDGNGDDVDGDGDDVDGDENAGNSTSFQSIQDTNKCTTSPGVHGETLGMPHMCCKTQGR